MKFLVLAVLLVIWCSASFSQPINTLGLPKEYYQRQNLPDIPGYIPVYIKHEDAPVVKYTGNSNSKLNEKDAVAEGENLDREKAHDEKKQKEPTTERKDHKKGNTKSKGVTDSLKRKTTNEEVKNTKSN